MLTRLVTKFHQIRLDLHQIWLRGRERAALRRLGEAVANSGWSRGNNEMLRVRSEMEATLTRIAELAEAARASLAADRADFAVVAPWVKPVVAVRGLSARVVLRHRKVAMQRGLGPHYIALGKLAAAEPEYWYPLEREVTTLRARHAAVLAERQRRLAPLGATAFPWWSARVVTESLGFGRAVLVQLRSHLLPKAPALAGLAVGWWIARTYTDSHLQSVLRSIGIGKGGTRVVSSSTYEAMSFWLPLLAAALCAYLGERLAAYDTPPREPRRPVAECRPEEPAAGADSSIGRPGLTS
jgi:hypothetical protein